MEELFDRRELEKGSEVCEEFSVLGDFGILEELKMAIYVRCLEDLEVLVWSSGVVEETEDSLKRVGFRKFREDLET